MFSFRKSNSAYFSNWTAQLFICFTNYSNYPAIIHTKYVYMTIAQRQIICMLCTCTFLLLDYTPSDHRTKTKLIVPNRTWKGFVSFPPLKTLKQISCIWTLTSKTGGWFGIINGDIVKFLFWPSETYQYYRHCVKRLIIRNNWTVKTVLLTFRWISVVVYMWLNVRVVYL